MRDSIAPDANPAKHRGSVYYILAGMLIGLAITGLIWAAVHYL